MMGPMVDNAIWQTHPCLVIWEKESGWGPEYRGFSAFWKPHESVFRGHIHASSLGKFRPWANLSKSKFRSIL